MKKICLILSAISFILCALVDFGKSALETYFRILLMNGKIGNFSSSHYDVDTRICQTILLAVGVICLVVFVVPFFTKDKK